MIDFGQKFAIYAYVMGQILFKHRKKVTKTHKTCSRCGKGVFMSEHKDRRTCGKCGLTEFSQ